MANRNRREEANSTFDKERFPVLGEGVYLIEEEYRGTTIYVVYIPEANFGYKLTEPLYRFLCLCGECKYSMSQIIEKMLAEFEVEQEELEQDLVQVILKFEKFRIIENKKK